jgi:hypothetical protein
VRHLARSEHTIARSRLVALLADLDNICALEDVEPLLLLVVQVPRRPTLVQTGDLGNRESAVGVQGRNLDVYNCSCEPDLALLPKPISTCRDVVSQRIFEPSPATSTPFLDADRGSP